MGKSQVLLKIIDQMETGLIAWLRKDASGSQWSSGRQHSTWRGSNWEVKNETRQALASFEPEAK